MQLAACQRRLEHVARVHRAFGLASADHGVQLVDEDDGLAFIFRQLFQHGLQALLEFAAKLGAGQQRGHVERQHPLALERVWHFARDDALGQPFDDGGLADARFTDEHWIVLGAALQHLDGTANFLVATDDRVELAQACAFGQVHAVLFERLALTFSVGAVHALPAAHCFDGGFERLASYAVAARQVADVGLAVGQCEQEQFTGDELVIALDGFFFGGLQQLVEFRSDLYLIVALHLRQLLDGGFGRLRQARHVDPRPLQQRARSFILPQHRRQQMGGFDVGVVVTDRERLGVAQRFLEFGGEFVLAHGSFLHSK